MKNKKDKEFGVVFRDKLILAVKTPNSEVFAGNGTEVFMCDTELELSEFIKENNLKNIY